MCVNDLVCQGAEPLFFLDYFATGRLETDQAARIIEGIARGCAASGCALIGGETAEMPGMYGDGEYDLAGFAVGAVERSAVLDGSRVRAGHVLLGLASSGPHSNGYSLIRKVIERAGPDIERTLEQSLDGAGTARNSLGDALLAPTRIYVKPVLSLLQGGGIDGLAHITGGGLTENIVRVVPDGLGLDIDTGAWQRPPVFGWLQETGGIAETEMLRTFNCGIGMVMLTAEAEAGRLLTRARDLGLECREIGRVVDRADAERVRYLP
jgi:phosphoribosylformylglycinamidine cyclo-ligase